MWDMPGIHNFPHTGEVIQTLQSYPKAFGPGISITSSAEKAAEACHHSDSFSERWWPCGRLRIVGTVGEEGFPFSLLEKHGTGNLRGLTTQFGEMKDPPCNHHINSKTGLDPICTTQLSLFYLATALESSMVHLDSPAHRVPGKFLRRFIKRGHLAGSQEHPLQGFHMVGGVHFLGQDGPKRHFHKRRFPLRRLQGDVSKPHFKPCHPAWTCPPTGHTNLLDAARLLPPDFLPQLPLSFDKKPIIICSHQNLPPGGSLQAKAKSS